MAQTNTNKKEQTMKKFKNVFLVFAVLAAFSFAACSDGGDDDNSSSTNTSSSQGESGDDSVSQSITAVTYTVQTDGAGSMTTDSVEANGGLTIFTSSAGDITVKTATGSKPKLDSNKYVQFNTSSSAEFDALVITVSAACKATFTLNACGDTATKVYSLNGTSLTKESSYYTQEISLSAGENTIKGSGFKFSKIAFE